MHTNDVISTPVNTKSLVIVLFVMLLAGNGDSGEQARIAPSDRSWAVLKEALGSHDYAVRLLATETLGEIRNVDVTLWLEHSLGDPEHDVRIAAVDALAHINSSRALALLRSVRDDHTEALDVRALASSALIRAGE